MNYRKSEAKDAARAQFRGVWAAKSNPNDPDCVRLAVNGETITFQRSVECIVPEPYLVVAKNATYPKFKQEPGKGRKVAAYGAAARRCL